MYARIRNSVAKRGFGVLILELIILILGIVIAFQIDRWAEYRRDRAQEHHYLMRLHEDLQLEMQSMSDALRYADSRIADVLFLEEVIADRSLGSDRPTDVVEALEKATWRSWPQIDAFVYSELQSTGNLALIRSESLRRELANHYTSIRSYSRVALDREIQRHFDRLTAGILTSAELQAIEEYSWNEQPFSVSPERGTEVVLQFAARQKAISLLPSIAQHHVFNKKVIGEARSQAQKILEHIELLINYVND